MSEGSDWFVHDLPICNIDCNAPVTCLVNDKCRCARNTCGEEPILSPKGGSLQNRDDLSFGYAESRNLDKPAVKDLATDRTALSLQALVDDLPWDRVIRPEARQLFSLPVSAFASGHILDLPHDIDDHMAEPACYDLSKADVPTMADHFLVQAFSKRAAAIDEADFAVIPYYQGCYYNYLKHNTYKKLADTVSYAETQITFSEQLRASNIVVPFLHDWGSVRSRQSLISELRANPTRSIVHWLVAGCRGGIDSNSAPSDVESYILASQRRPQYAMRQSRTRCCGTGGNQVCPAALGKVWQYQRCATVKRPEAPSLLQR